MNPTEPNSKPPVKKTNKWLDHVRKFREENPNKSYKECLTLAKATYNKTD